MAVPRLINTVIRFAVAWYFILCFCHCLFLIGNFVRVDSPRFPRSSGIDGSEKTIDILGDRWWPQTARQEGDKMSKKFLCNIWKKRSERPNVGGVSIRSRNGAPSRKGRVVSGQMTKAKVTYEYAPPPS